MNVTPAQHQLAAKKEAAACEDYPALSDFHAFHIARVEAALREAAKRVEESGDSIMAMEFMGLHNDVKAAHARATALALKAGVEVGVRSGER